MSSKATSDTGSSVLVTGIVLAGGRSSRFGSSKLDADLAGVSVLDHTIAALSEIAPDVIVVGRDGRNRGGRNRGRRNGGRRNRGGRNEAARYLDDQTPFAGPLAGLASALDASAAGLALVVGGDMPLLRPAVLGLLLERLETREVDAAGLEVDGDLRPLPIAIRVQPARNAARVAMAGTRRSLRDLLAGLPTAAIPEATWREIDPDGDTILDIDRAPDLAHALRRLEARG